MDTRCTISYALRAREAQDKPRAERLGAFLLPFGGRTRMLKHLVHTLIHDTIISQN
jgi:hypothetical protein